MNAATTLEIIQRMNTAFEKNSHTMGSAKNEIKNAVINAGFNLQAGAHPNHVFGRLSDKAASVQGGRNVRSERAAIDSFCDALELVLHPE